MSTRDPSTFEKEHGITFKVDLSKNLFEQLNWLSQSEILEWFELYKKESTCKT